jgi:hypothetical protein
VDPWVSVGFIVGVEPLSLQATSVETVVPNRRALTIFTKVLIPIALTLYFGVKKSFYFIISQKGREILDIGIRWYRCYRTKSLQSKVGI